MGDIVKAVGKGLKYKPEDKNFWLSGKHGETSLVEANVAKAQALESIGWEAAAMRDYRKALALASPIEYINLRLEQQAKYRDQLVKQFDKDLRDALEITGSMATAKTMAQSNLISHANYYSRLLEEQYPGLSDASNKLAKDLANAASSLGK